MNLYDRYPHATIELAGLSIKIGGVKSPENDPVLARAVAIEICDLSSYHHGAWWLPAWPTVVEAMVKHLEVDIPAPIQEHVDLLRKVEGARAKANIWRKLPIEEQRAWLQKIGVRFRGPQPLNHQVTSIGWTLQYPWAGLFLDTGLGKTFVGATVFQALKDLKKQGPFLVVAPKSILRVGWGEDIEKFTWLTWMDIGDPPAPEPVTVCPQCKRDFKDKPVPKAHLKSHDQIKSRLAKAAADAETTWPTRLQELLKDGNELTEEGLETKRKEYIAECQEPIWDRVYAAYPGLRPAGAIERRERVTRALARDDIDVYVINPEQAKAFKDELIARRFSMVIVDESSMMRAYNSQTTEALIDIGWSCARRAAMSGTPRPNSNLELWGQFTFLDSCFGPSYRVFRDKFFMSDAQGYKWFSRPGMDAKFSDMIEERTLRYKLDNCVDLPGETTETREVDLNDELRAHYKTMLEEMIVELEDEKVATPYKLVQINKLAQITSGFIYDKDQKEHFLSDANPKLQETVATARRLVEDEDRSVVIWIRFSDLEATAMKIALGKFGVSTLVGGQSSSKTESEIEKFKSGQNRIMVAHPLSAKFGHTWVHSTVAIFHSYDYSWENYYQAKRRIYRIGQTKPVTYINIVARRTVDKVIMTALARKENESAVVIDRQFIAELKKTI